MSTILEVYDAFKSAGVPEEQAKKASEAISSYDEGRLTNIEGRLTNVEGRLTTIEKDILNMEGRLTNMEGRLTNMEGRLTTIEKDRLPAIEKEIHLLKWMVGVVIAGILYLVLRTVPL